MKKSRPLNGQAIAAWTVGAIDIFFLAFFFFVVQADLTDESPSAIRYEHTLYPHTYTQLGEWAVSLLIVLILLEIVLFRVLRYRTRLSILPKTRKEKWIVFGIFLAAVALSYAVLAYLQSHSAQIFHESPCYDRQVVNGVMHVSIPFCRVVSEG